MRIEFDPTKDVSNQLKHCVSLAMAAELDWDAAWVWVDMCEESSVFVEPTDAR